MDHAEGGYVHGNGDVIPAIIDNGYVLPKQAVNHIGLEFLRQLNEKREEE